MGYQPGCSRERGRGDELVDVEAAQVVGQPGLPEYFKPMKVSRPAAISSAGQYIAGSWSELPVGDAASQVKNRARQAGGGALGERTQRRVRRYVQDGRGLSGLQRF